jgi:outer membrane murein-binding lipoprotein Lpp
MKQPIAIALSISLAASGCATGSRDIAISYTSPIQYQSYDCNQIASEAQRLQSRVSQLGGRLDEAATNDKALVGIGLILFWPALLALGGTKQQEAEYARIKGEHEALQQSAVAKKCPGVVAPALSLAPQAADLASNPFAVPAPIPLAGAAR